MVDVLTVNEQPVYLVLGQTPLGPASGDLSGLYPGPTVSKVAGVTPGAEGLLLLATATAAAALAALGISPAVAAGYPNIVTAPVPSQSGSFGGYPRPSSAIASIPVDPAATLARYNFGV